MLLFIHIAVSMQILQEDVHTLKNGIKTLQLEMKKEPNNFIIFISFTATVTGVWCIISHRVHTINIYNAYMWG